MRAFASVDDIINMWRPLSESEQTRAEYLLDSVSAELRVYARNLGKELDDIVSEDKDMAVVARSVTVDTVARVLNQKTEMEALSQMSQSAGGYTISGTYLVPGGGSLVLNRDLKRLGLKRQKYGLRDMYDMD